MSERPIYFGLFFVQNKFCLNIFRTVYFLLLLKKNKFNDNKNRFFVFLENNHVQKGKFFDTFFDNFFRLYAYSKPDF